MKVTTNGQTYTITGKTSRVITREDGSVLGEAFRMPGDKRWMVTAIDFRGNGFPIYYDTAEIMVRAMERNAK